MTTTNTRTRPTEALCPPWCSGHDDMWLPWEHLVTDDGEGLIRHHESNPAMRVSDVYVYLTAAERTSAGVGQGRVLVDVDPSGPCELTSEQARQLAADLIAQAETVETWEATR